MSMFVLGHMGIGSKLVRPWIKGLPLRWVFFGTLFPDLIDKPVYYLFSFLTGKRGLELGLISGTRTFGHTGLLLLAITLFALLRKSRPMAAFGAGMMTHLFLDNFVEHFTHFDSDPVHLALLFPLQGMRFPVVPFQDLQNHLSSMWNSFTIWGEIVGGGLLAWDYWKSKHRPEIVEKFKRLRKRFKAKPNERMR